MLFTDPAETGHARVIARGREVGWENVGLPIIAVAEALDGRLRYLREAQRRSPSHLVRAYMRLSGTIQVVTEFANVPFDSAALDVHTRARVFPGTMSRADRLIAAIAIAGNHRLVTRNVAHFVDVPGLVIENWIDDPPG